LVILLSSFITPHCATLNIQTQPRRHEYEAYRFVVKGIGRAQARIDAFLRLTKVNLSNLTWHPRYHFYHCPRSTTSERITALETYERTRSAEIGRASGARSAR
jgi:hypothetical protein